MMIHQQQLLFPNMKFHLVNLIYTAGGIFSLSAGMLHDMKTFVCWLQSVFFEAGRMNGGLYEQQRI